MSTMLNKGFTLIEIMIVVAIVGIISAIAFPSYQNSVANSRRADAQASLLELAQFMERQYTSNSRYTTGANDLRPNLPFNVSPKGGSSVFYNLAFNDAGLTAEQRRTRYTLTATPAGPMAGDKCGTLTLTNTGVKGLDNQLAGVTVNDCWRN